MPLPIGSRFGPYEVAAQLGEGGMGEVYRAHDTRLGRDVALKVLHSDVAQNTERRTRFEREARAVAALNHPNIVAIFDIGEENGVVYFASELVEGGSLRDRVGAGPLGVRELLDIAAQIADGMAAAHSAGITHRDLKPENIMLTRDGRVKILDFGLARQAAVVAPSADRTVTMHETQPGTVMGTANYMSPEQVRGLAVDYRSDQFSFGVILYEMATGKQAFQRDTAVQTMSAVITDDPPVMDPAVQAKLPPPLRWVMERCLAKEPSRRYESTRDLYADLRAQREHLSETYSSSALPAVKARSRVNVWKIASGALLLTTLALGVLLFTRQHDGETIAQYRFSPFAVGSEPESNPVWSRDGKAVAFLGEVNGENQLFVRYLVSRMPTQLTTTGASNVYAWSPDSRRIFFGGKNPAKDGPDRAVFSIAAVGGDPEMLMPYDSRVLDISPDGATLAVYKEDKDGFRRIYISSPIGSPLKPYPSEEFAAKFQANDPQLHFSPDGKKMMLLKNDGVERRWLLPYPAGTGEPREILKSLPQHFTPDFAWFPDSRHVLLSFGAHQGEPNNLWIGNIDSNDLRRLTSTPTNQNSPSLSPDGRRILYQDLRADFDIAKVDLADGKVIRLIATDRNESMPMWAAHTGKFVYVTSRSGPHEIWLRNEDGSDRPVVTQADFAPATVNVFMDPVLSPEGDRVIYTMFEAGGKILLYISSTSGGPPTRVTNSDASAELAGSLSPDGKQLVYLAVEGNKADLTVVKTTGQATPTRIREDVDGRLPQWSPTGEWITFKDDSGWHLISPDGKNLRDLGKLDVDHLTFSLDGKTLYGIRKEKEHEYLFSMSVAGGASKTIADLGADFAPASDANPGYRLSVAPDGTCAIYSIATIKSSLWLFEGFKP
jgi:serine/threonine protein kinase